MNRKKILVVDDEVSMRILLSNALTINGHDVKTAEHGQQALLLIDNMSGTEKYLPDIVITDVGMAVLDGVGLARQLRMRSISPEIIFMSGGLGSHTEEELRQYSPYYLAKPFRLATLIGLVEQLLHIGVHD